MYVFSIHCNPSYDKQLCGYFQKCTCLQALQLESFCDDGICEMWAGSAVKWSMLSCFLELMYCRMAGNHSDVIQSVTTNCKRLTIFQCSSMECLTVSSVSTTDLQKLSIDVDITDLPDVFMQTVSAHGGLVHVVLSANLITTEGINLLFQIPWSC